jgi:hypothetical protein
MVDAALAALAASVAQVSVLFEISVRLVHSHRLQFGDHFVTLSHMPVTLLKTFSLI